MNEAIAYLVALSAMTAQQARATKHAGAQSMKPPINLRAPYWQRWSR